MRDLGILGNVQPVWLYFDRRPIERVFGIAGMRYFIPLRSYAAPVLFLPEGATKLSALIPRGAPVKRGGAQDVHFLAAYMQFNESNRGSH